MPIENVSGTEIGRRAQRGTVPLQCGGRDDSVNEGEWPADTWTRGIERMPRLCCHLAEPLLVAGYSGYSFCQDLTAILTCFPVPNLCKQICSHLCLLRPGGYSCACPQGSSFIEGSTTECDAGRSTAQAAMGAWEHSSAAFRSQKNPCMLGPLQQSGDGWKEG